MPHLAVSDVHALGASGSRVYIGSPQAGVLVSNDGGKTFNRASNVGRHLMGTIWVDPADPDVAIAPSMLAGAVKTIDGGRTWSSLGSPPGSMAVAVDAHGERLMTIGMDGADASSDGGATWTPLDVPDGASATAYAADGKLVVAVPADGRANVYQSVDGRWDPLA